MELGLIHLFVQVVKSGGFSKAAQSLRIPKSTVSKAVSRLESETGTKLLLRTTRSQRLTAAGKSFYDACVGPLESLEGAQKSLYGNDRVLSGKIKLTAPEDLGSEVIAPAAGFLIQKYPGLSFELIYTHEVLDLVQQGFDLAVRIGELDGSSLQVKKIGEVKLILVSSPAYLKNNPKITRLEDIASHSCLFLGDESIRGLWKLKSENSSKKISIQPKIISNQMSSLLKATLAGGGISLVPAYLAHRHIREGELTHVLPQWISPGLSVSLLSPLPFSSSARLRLTADFLVGELKKALETRI